MKRFFLLFCVMLFAFAAKAQSSLFNVGNGENEVTAGFHTVDSSYTPTGELKTVWHSRLNGGGVTIVKGDSAIYRYSLYSILAYDTLRIVTYRGIPVRVDSIHHAKVYDEQSFTASHNTIVNDTIYISIKKKTFPVYRFMLKDCMGTRQFYFSPAAGLVFVRYTLFRHNEIAYITQFATFPEKEKQEFIFKLYARLMKKKYKYYIW